MWAVQGINLQITEGDYGVELPVKVKGATLDAGDTLAFVFLTAKNGSVVLEKAFTGVEDNTVALALTEEEIALFTPGSYVYRLDWFKDGEFFCNIIPEAVFKVVDKA